MKYYSRDIERTIRKAAGQFRVIVLTGARQTGKSTLLQHLFARTHHYVSLDNPRDLKLAQDDPELFFDEHQRPLVIDEIQYAPGLLKHIKMAVDQSWARGQFIITGSQQFTLMKGLRETLAGRVALFQLMPMSIREAGPAKSSYAFRAMTGSYPELLTVPGIDPERWFGSYLSTYIEKDVQLHYGLEKTALFRDLLFLLAARCSQILNCQSLASDLGLSVPTIKSWVKILEASQIIYLLRPFYVNLGSRIVKSPKIYFTDIGLVSYLTGGRSEKSATLGPHAGPLFENFVVQETVKHYTNQGKTPPLYYYRTNNGLEVDLIIEKKLGVIQPCEIKLTKTPHEGMARSMDRLRMLNKKKNFILSEGRVVCLAPAPHVLTRTAKACPIGDFLKEL